jgi:hypothetical protein
MDASDLRPGEHIIALKKELEIRQLAQKLISVKGEIKIYQLESGIENLLAGAGISAAPMILMGALPYKEWLKSRKGEPLDLEDAVAIAEHTIKSEPDSPARNIALEVLGKRAGVSEYNWHKNYLNFIRARLEETLALPEGKVGKLIPIPPEELEARLEALIQEGLSGAKLTNRLNHLAAESGRHVLELRKQYSERLSEVEREEGREDTQSQVDALLDASTASVDLREVLPCSLAEPLLKLANWLSLKPECYLTALLVTTSTLHKAGTKVVLNKEWDFDPSVNLFGGVIGDSSQKKSPILKAICKKPLSVLQREALKKYKQQVRIYEQELKEWEETKSEDRGEPPEKPNRKIYFFTKTTGEGLTYQAGRCPEQGMLFLSDELAGMLSSQNQYRGGKGSDKQDLLSYYDGSGDVVLRAEGIKSEVDFISLGLLGGVQPQVIQRLLDDCSDPDGSWARFIFVNQPNTASQMEIDGGKYDLTELLIDLYRRIDVLPITEYRLSPKAFKLFCQAYNSLEQLRVNSPLAGMRSVWGKSEGRIGKLAVNLHVIHCLMKGEIPSEEIPVEMVRIAIDLTNFYAQQVQSLYVQFSDPDTLAPQLLKVLNLSSKKGWIKASDIYLSITKKQRPSGETVREWFTELAVMNKGEVRGQGRSLQFRAFLPNDPPPPLKPKLDDFRQVLDKSSNTQTTLYQCVHEKLDKLDDLDDFPKNSKNSMEVQELQGIEAEATPATGLEKELILDSLSKTSKFAQNTQLEQVTALDNPSNKSSNLDNLLMEEAISPAVTEPVALPKTSVGVIDSQVSQRGGVELPDFDRDQVSDRIDQALDKLGWSIDQIHDYLISTYKKKSRKYLSDGELRDFFLYLEAHSAEMAEAEQAAPQSDPMKSPKAIAPSSTPAAPKETASPVTESPQLQPGDRIWHPEFGAGIIDQIGRHIASCTFEEVQNSLGEVQRKAKRTPKVQELTRLDE